jgi:hypothetical protein
MNRRHFDVPSSLIAHPAMIALAVSVLSVLAMLIVDHGPWSRPHIQTAELATHKTTGEAARAAGAEVRPTEPKAPLEPAPLAPKQVQPANPITR